MKPARTARLLTAFAVSVPGVMLASQGGLSATFGALALLAWVAVPAGGRIKLGTVAQIVLHVIAGIALTTAAVAIGRQGPRPGVMITIGFLALTAPRLWLQVGRPGQSATLTLGMIALMGMARETQVWGFGTAVAVYLTLALAATHVLSGDWSSVPRRPAQLVPFAGGLVVAAFAMMGMGWFLPAAEPVVTEALQPYLFDETTGRAGFGDGQIKLGDLREIVTSDEVVMRVHGEADYLRGEVLVDYRLGRWVGRDRADIPERFGRAGALSLGGKADGKTIRIEADEDAGQMLFAPLAAMALTEAPGDVVLDPYGIVRPSSVAPLTDALTYGWRLGSPADRRIAPPDQRDTYLPLTSAARYRALAAKWGHGAVTPAERVEAIRKHLVGEFDYSLELAEVPSKEDPVLHFLTVARRGHCEYFASGLVLLSRALDVPARVVVGYRVFERNPVGDYYVVRQRDAHAWAEVFVDGVWRTVEATPAGVLAGESTPTSGWWGARLDIVSRAVSRAIDRLSNLSFDELLVVGGVVAALLLGWVLLRRRRRPAVVERVDVLETFEPLAQLEAFLVRKARLERAPHEPLGGYARRLRAAEFADAAELVEACAALRYGGQGDPAAVADAVQRYVQ